MITVNPVAVVHNARDAATDDNWGSVVSTIELADGIPTESLDGIETFSHAEILFHFDRLPEDQVVSGSRHPRGNVSWPKIGIFAQRGAPRPNRIGATIVKIEKREGRVLTVRGLDAADGTPVIDIKPVMREFLPPEEIRQPTWSRELMRQYWFT